jgi:AcrR family transcriptional regulator
MTGSADHWQQPSPEQDAVPVEDGASTSQRILAATAEVLARKGMTKFSLSAVALQAGVSRVTLYRRFASKAKLLDAFLAWERQMFGRGINAATAGLPGRERLDAALRFIVEYQQSYSGYRMVDIEPGYVVGHLSEVMPIMRQQLERLLPGPNGAVAAATAIRVAVSHYLVRSDDADQFLTQLRYAVGIGSAQLPTPVPPEDRPGR